MSINRTYQGKVTGAYWVSGKNHARDYELCEDSLARALTNHLSIYHTAINYYLVCFAAMAKGSEVEALKNLYNRVKDSWDSHDYRRGGKGDGFQTSLLCHIGHIITADMSFDEACDKLIERRKDTDETLQLALESLLKDLGGESSIQQGGRSYLPYFCNPQSKANFPRSSKLIERAAAKTELPPLLYSVSKQGAQELIKAYKMHHFVNLDESKDAKTGTPAIGLLHNCNKHLHEQNIINESLHATNRKTIEELEPSNIQIPAYMGAAAKGAEKDRLYAFILLHWLPYSYNRFVTLKSTYPEPKENSSDKKISATKQKELDYEAHLQSLGEDPILLARGDRKYVFQSFSSRFTRQPSDSKPEWVELDISAFKEALKTLNQIDQKTAERQKEIQDLQKKVDYYTTKKGSTSDPDEPVTFHKDARLGEGLELWNEFKKEATSESTAEHGENSIRWRSIKGWGDLREKYQRHLKKNNAATKEEIIQEVWVPYQAKNKNIGNTHLFHTLADPKFHILWKEVEEGDLSKWSKNEWSHNLLADLVHYDELLGRVEELYNKPSIRLTPAHIKHSRRPIMLSDLTGSSKVVHLEREKSKHSLVTSIYAKKEDSSAYSQHRIELCFSAPRLSRDNISGSENRTLLQPLVKGLGLSVPDPESVAPQSKELAVAIMPDFGRSTGNIPSRFLLNFPATLNTEWIAQALGKEDTWKGQFFGTTDENFYIHWSQTLKTNKVNNGRGWWENPTLINNGFTVFSVDLGLKAAAAYTTLKVVSSYAQVPEKKKKHARFIGDDGTYQWFAYPVARGTLRLPGEDAKTLRPISKENKTLQRATEFGGATGREATPAETVEFQEQIANLKNKVADWLSKEVETSPTRHFAAQNDILLKAIKQAQGYLSNRHAIVALSKEENLLERASEESNERQKVKLDAAFKIQDPKLREITENEITSLQIELKHLLILIANRVLSQRDYNWIIEKSLASEDSLLEHNYTLKRVSRPDGDRVQDENARLVRYQRGLSASRIEQLEDLRRRALSLQRELNRKPGSEMSIGKDRFTGSLNEAAPEVLDKIDHLKDQRVKQTAHLILTQALGLRLTTNKNQKTTKEDHFVHGEYEKIPNAEVADFIVIEDLSRYLTTQGKSKAENRQLMQWSHRAITDTLKELCQPFGLSVVSTSAGWSSRYCASTSRPGFRATTITKKNLNHYALEQFRKADAGSDERKLADQIDGAFKQPNNKHLQLLIPTEGGTMFVPIITAGEERKDFPVLQADLNASHNVALRALAAPGQIDILHKVRVKSGNSLRTDNERERKAYNSKDKLTPKSGEFSTEIRGKKFTNFFHLGEKPLPIALDRTTINANGNRVEVASSLAVWGHVKKERFKQCIEINNQRL